jgi:hypothetical protein
LNPYKKYTFRGTKTYDLVRTYLQRVAQRQAQTTYARVARIMGLSRSFGPTWHEPITALLAESAEDDTGAGRPPLCSLVLRAAKKRPGGGRYAAKGPGSGYYRTMCDVNRKVDDSTDIEAWKREVEAVYQYYKRT